jgi:hypothetical protein
MTRSPGLKLIVLQRRRLYRSLCSGAGVSLFRVRLRTLFNIVCIGVSYIALYHFPAQQITDKFLRLQSRGFVDKGFKRWLGAKTGVTDRLTKGLGFVKNYMW